MRQSPLFAAIALALASASLPACATAGSLTAEQRQALDAAVASSTRTAANVARDRYRNPAETLAFFGIEPDDTVVEMWPGGGWYTEILAPYAAAGDGTLYVVAPDQGLNGVRRLMTANPDLYGRVRLAPFAADAASPPVPDNSVDAVLTFRNVHNWAMGDNPFADSVFRQMYAMLKPGGVLGIVDHRLPEDADSAREKSSGYLKVSTVRRLAEQAGFRFAGASEVNANPKDSADWPGGVWTLPPALRGPEGERDKYVAIGESDRMTLKFVKPEQ